MPTPNARSPIAGPIPVFFDARMVAPNTSSSPSAQKPAQVMASWRSLGVWLDERPVAPVRPDELAQAHDERFVTNVLACHESNGFGNRNAKVAASLPFTSGAMLSAARHVLTTRAPVAVAPCSGFHHAGHAHTGGYCTFNGLMVTAACLRAEGLATRVGIVDCDMHYGDGTEDIIAELNASTWVKHWTAGASYGDARQAKEFLTVALPEALASMSGCDIVLYQAGADPHVADPLGGFLTTPQLRRRDEIVFLALAEMGIPVVWNLAGGYQTEADGSIPKVLEIHNNTMRACADVFGGLGAP